MSSLGQVIKDVLGRNEEYMLAAVEGLSDEELHQRPAPESNPIGWLMWHLSRVQDFAVSSMGGQETVWVREGWHERFGMAPDPAYRGNGDTNEQTPSSTRWRRPTSNAWSRLCVGRNPCRCASACRPSSWSPSITEGRSATPGAPSKAGAG